MEDKELHPVVELLLARMKSHPEEFQAGTNRWDWVLQRVQDNGSEADILAMNEGLRPIRLSEVHEWMMSELLNGEERREQVEYDRNFGASLRNTLRPAIERLHAAMEKGV